MIPREFKKSSVRCNARGKSKINFIEADDFVRGTDLPEEDTLHTCGKIRFRITSPVNRILRQ